MPDVPLSEAGRAQAAAVASQLREMTQASAIMSSDSVRALETAKAIGGQIGLPVRTEAALRERNFGIARGQLYADIGGERQKLWRDPHYRIDQGESWADVYDRMKAFLDGLKTSPPGRELILVTHGGTMNVALAYLAGKTVEESEVVALENCAVRSVVIDTES